MISRKTNDAAAIAGDVVDEAIGWMVASREGLSSEEQAELQAWLDGDLRHLAAWRRLQGALDPFRVIEKQQVSGETLVSALAQRRVSRRAVLANGTMALGAMALTVGAADRISPISGMFADYRTATGQRRRFLLPDGSALTLDARSEADLAGAGRGVALRSGIAFVNVRRSSKPFVLDGGQASAALSEGSVMLSRRSDRLRMICTRGTAQLHLPEGASERMGAGTGFEIADGTARALPYRVAEDATSWLDGRLILHDQPLEDMVNAFRPYRAGVLTVSAEAARLKVSGVFNLNQLDEVLTALPELFSVKVFRIGDLFARIAMT